MRVWLLAVVSAHQGPLTGWTENRKVLPSSLRPAGHGPVPLVGSAAMPSPTGIVSSATAAQLKDTVDVSLENRTE